MKKNKVCLYLGVGPRPIHPQHLAVMEEYSPVGEWILVDKYVKEPGTKNWDARNLDEVESGSVDIIYSSHLLEHLGLKEILPTLVEWYRVLKKGGVVVINVPDMEWLSQSLLATCDREHPTLEYDKSKLFTTAEKLMEVVYGNQDHEGEFHKSGYTVGSLWKYLEIVGFQIEYILREFEAHQMGVLLAKAKK